MDINYVELGSICKKGSSNVAQKDLSDHKGKYPIYGASGFIMNVDFAHQNKPYIAVVKDGAGVGRVMLLPANSSVIGTMQYILPNDNVDIDYLFYALQYMNLSKYYSGATIPHIYFKDYQKEKILLPSLDIQRKKAEVLHKIDELKNWYNKYIVKFDTLIKSRFIEMFGDPQINTYGFEKVTINDICSSIVRGPFGSALKKEFFVEPNNTTYKVYEQKNAIQKCAKIGTYYITEEKYEELKRFECFAGDIIMSCSGTMGELYQLPEDCERGIINQALCKFTLNKRILPIVFLVYMKQIIGKLETKGTGIKNIAAVSYIKNMTINLPSMKIQNQFAAFAQQVNKSELAVKASLEKLETLKKSLMQQYFG